MSSILKSLRKLESQKRDGATAPDLMVDQGGGAAPRSSALLPLAAGIVLGALAVALLLFLTMRGEEAVSPPVTTAQPMTEPPAVAAPVAATPVAREARADQVAAPPPTAISTSVARPQIAGPVLPAVQPRRQAAVAEAPAEAPVVKDVAATPRAQAATPQPPAAAVAAKTPVAAAATHSSGAEKRPALQVSEIFYQEDRVNSMAVVNDLPVMVGTQVDSAVVREILPDAVVFTLGDRTVTVPVSKP